MSNSALPKGEQTAYQRWEMTSFGEKRSSHLERVEIAEKISQAELTVLREAAYKAAYATAYEDAYALAYEEGKSLAYQETQAEGFILLEGLIQLKKAFEQQLIDAHRHVGQELMDLAIELASAMTQTQLKLRPEAIIPIVNEAINLLPSIRQPAHLILHPEDIAIVTSILGEQLENSGWRLIADAQLARGGCRLETAENLVDATYASRWARLTELMSTTLEEQAEQAITPVITESDKS